MSDQEKAQLLTEYIQKTHPEWTYEKSLHTIIDAKGWVEWTTGPDPAIKIMGETILVGGKDITGNLGSKTTTGDYSPIVENNGGTFNNGPTQESHWFSMNNPFVYVFVFIVLAFITYWGSKLKWPLRFGSNSD